MNIKNPYVRLQSYISILSTSSSLSNCDDELDGYSINSLHNLLNIDKRIIRKDILTIIKWQSNISKKNKLSYDKNRTIINFSKDCPVYVRYNKECNLESLFEETMIGNFQRPLEDLFLNGDLDDLLLYIDSSEKLQSYTLTLTDEQFEALKSFRLSNSKKYSDLKGLPNYQRPYKIKDSYSYIHNYDKLFEKLDKLNYAITNDETLKLTYLNHDITLIAKDFKPLKITYDANENLYSTITIENDEIIVYRLDRILKLEKSNVAIIINDINLLEKAPFVWGNEYSADKHEVKVRFNNEANVFKKVKKELSGRSEKTLYEDDGYLFYEDTVYGIDSFKTWIYSFGSSVLVLEPISLKNEIIDSLKKRKEKYNNKKNSLN